jgi:hypothetical protein
MRPRPEPTQLDHLSDAFFLGKLLGLPANVRLDWKVIARYKPSSLIGLVISNEGKKFYNIDPRVKVIKHFCLRKNKLERLSPEALMSKNISQ